MSLSTSTFALAAALALLLPLGSAASTPPEPFARNWTLSPRDRQDHIRAGEETTLVLRGLWRDGCAPRGPHQDISVQCGPQGRSLIQLRTPESGCGGNVPTAFELELNPIVFRAEEAGIHRFIVLLESPTWAGFQLLPLVELDVVVRPASSPEAAAGAWPVGGAWQALGAEGSGLFLHEQRSPEAQRVSGLWLNFDSAGRPRWHLLADARWHTPSRLEGAVFAAAAEGYACTLQAPNPDCDVAARPATAISPSGRFAIEFDSATRASLQFVHLDNTGAPVSGAPIALEKLP